MLKINLECPRRRSFLPPFEKSFKKSSQVKHTQTVKVERSVGVAGVAAVGVAAVGEPETADGEPSCVDVDESHYVVGESELEGEPEGEPEGSQVEEHDGVHWETSTPTHTTATDPSVLSSYSRSDYYSRPSNFCSCCSEKKYEDLKNSFLKLLERSSVRRGIATVVGYVAGASLVMAIAADPRGLRCILAVRGFSKQLFASCTDSCAAFCKTALGVDRIVPNSCSELFRSTTALAPAASSEETGKEVLLATKSGGEEESDSKAEEEEEVQESSTPEEPSAKCLPTGDSGDIMGVLYYVVIGVLVLSIVYHLSLKMYEVLLAKGKSRKTTRSSSKKSGENVKKITRGMRRGDVTEVVTPSNYFPAGLV